MKTKPTKWTLVQHSGYGYAAKPAFKLGVETRQVEGAKEIERVRRAGGMLFDSYGEAEDQADIENYPKGYEGLEPRVLGTFADAEVDQLRVYIPKLVSAASR